MTRKKQEGISYTCYLNAYERGVIEEILQLEGKEPTREEVRATARIWADNGVSAGLQHSFVHYREKRLQKMRRWQAVNVEELDTSWQYLEVENSVRVKSFVPHWGGRIGILKKKADEGWQVEFPDASTCTFDGDDLMKPGER